MKNMGRGLDRTVLKILAVISMTIDHLGYELFPGIQLFRILGRLAFPLFSWFIFEGCKYTRNRRKYFLQIFLLGLVCVLGFYVYEGEFYGNILITFSLSVLNIFVLFRFTEGMRKTESVRRELAGLCLILLTVFGTWLFCRLLPVDYGFCGVMAPVLAALFDLIPAEGLLFRDGLKGPVRRTWIPLAGFTVGLLLTAVNLGGIQYYSLLAVPLLLLYNGKKGRYSMKYFFYLYYPIHLLVIGGISMLF